MNLIQAIDNCIKNERVCRVDSGSLSSSRIEIRVKPITKIKNSQRHFIMDNHISRINNLTSKDVEKYQDLMNISEDIFIVQVAEKGENKMSEVVQDVSEKQDVFDENIFADKDEAVNWIRKSGYAE